MLASSYSFSSLALIACLALLLNLLLGGPRSLYASIAFLHPLAFFEKIAFKLSEKLNRFRRDDKTRRFRGLILTFSLVGMAITLGVLLTRFFLVPGGEYMEIMLLALFFGARPLLDWGRQIKKLLLHTPEIISAELLPLKLIRRQQKEYDSSTVLRGTIEAMALGLSEQVIAPLFYYLMLGWPGVLAVSTVTVLDRLIGYRNSQYAEFGKTAAVLHTILQWIPARITGILICITACFAPKCSPLAAVTIMLQQANRAVSRNAGWPIGAVAGALNITLGGPRTLFGSYIADQWIGEGKTQVSLDSLKAMQWLYGEGLLLLFMCLIFTTLI